MGWSSVSAICAAPNGDIWGCAANGYIYKNGIDQSWSDEHWYSICAAPNGDIWAGGNFVVYKNNTNQNWAHEPWRKLTAAPNGDIWASALNICKNGIDQGWNNYPNAICAAPNGDIWASFADGTVYKNGTDQSWSGDNIGSIYAAPNGDIWMVANTTANPPEENVYKNGSLTSVKSKILILVDNDEKIWTSQHFSHASGGTALYQLCLNGNPFPFKCNSPGGWFWESSTDLSNAESGSFSNIIKVNNNIWALYFVSLPEGVARYEVWSGTNFDDCLFGSLP